MSANQFMRIGIFYLEMAVTGVLLEAKENKQILRHVDIARKTGVQDRWQQSHWITRSVLYKLEAEGRIFAHRNDKGAAIGWELTDTEYMLLANTEQS